jgi:hypothetical protein
MAVFGDSTSSGLFGMGGTGLSGLGGAMNSFGSAASDLMSVGAYKQSAEGDVQAANDYAKVAELYGESKNIIADSGIIQTQQTERQIESVQGKTTAAAGGANVSSGGSVGDILRSNMRQGSLAKSLIAANTGMQEKQADIAQQGAIAQEHSALNAAQVAQQQASAAGMAGVFSMASGALGLFAAL